MSRAYHTAPQILVSGSNSPPSFFAALQLPVFFPRCWWFLFVVVIPLATGYLPPYGPGQCHCRPPGALRAPAAPRPAPAAARRSPASCSWSAPKNSRKPRPTRNPRKRMEQEPKGNRKAKGRNETSQIRKALPSKRAKTGLGVWHCGCWCMQTGKQDSETTTAKTITPTCVENNAKHLAQNTSLAIDSLAIGSWRSGQVAFNMPYLLSKAQRDNRF